MHAPEYIAHLHSSFGMEDPLHHLRVELTSASFVDAWKDISGYIHDIGVSPISIASFGIYRYTGAEYEAVSGGNYFPGAQILPAVLEERINTSGIALGGIVRDNECPVGFLVTQSGTIQVRHKKDVLMPPVAPLEATLEQLVSYAIFSAGMNQ